MNQAIHGSSSEDKEILSEKGKIYKEILELCPTLTLAHYNLGIIYEEQEKFNEAIEHFIKVVQLDPSFQYSYYALGCVFSKIKNPEEAVKWYKNWLDSVERENRLAMGFYETSTPLINVDSLKDMLLTPNDLYESFSISFSEGEIFSPSSISLDCKSPPMVVSMPLLSTHEVGGVYIDVNKSRFDDPPFRLIKKNLNEIGKAIKSVLSDSEEIGKDKGVTLKIEITVHTTTNASDELDLAVSKKIAESITNYLVTNFNIDREMLEFKGEGKFMPSTPILRGGSNLNLLISSGDKEALKALSNRVQFKFTKKVTK